MLHMAMQLLLRFLILVLTIAGLVFLATPAPAQVPGFPWPIMPPAPYEPYYCQPDTRTLRQLIKDNDHKSPHILARHPVHIITHLLSEMPETLWHFSREVPPLWAMSGDLKAQRLTAQVLCEQLGARKWQVRQAAENRLLDMGYVALPVLETFFGSKDMEIARRAARIHAAYFSMKIPSSGWPRIYYLLGPLDVQPPEVLPFLDRLRRPAWLRTLVPGPWLAKRPYRPVQGWNPCYSAAYYSSVRPEYEYWRPLCHIFYTIAWRQLNSDVVMEESQPWFRDREAMVESRATELLALFLLRHGIHRQIVQDLIFDIDRRNQEVGSYYRVCNSPSKRYYQLAWLLEKLP